MEPHLGNNDKLMFYKYLDKSTNYFEFGSGGSTYQAALRKNIHAIYSVESDLDWYNKLKDILKNESRLNYIYNEMDTKPNTWGHPGPNSTPLQHKNYSNHLVMCKDRNAIDLIMIDGRFRVASCLKCFDIINDRCLIAFDDFLDRPQYHVVLDYYDIIEQTVDKRMVILKKKLNVSVPKKLIETYERIQE
jgi:protein O-GlcNAc transferase